MHLCLNVTVISFSDNSKILAFILKQAFVIKSIEHVNRKRNMGPEDGSDGKVLVTQTWGLNFPDPDAGQALSNPCTVQALER